MPLEEAKDLGFGDDFRHADPLWNAEVCFILQQHLKDRENPASTLKGTPVNGMVHKTLDYVRKLNNYATKENLTMSQELFKKSRKFTQYESTLINNLNIGSVDEAFTLIPSLRDKFPQQEQLGAILENFQDYQKHDDNYGYNIHEASYLDEQDGQGQGGQDDMEDNPDETMNSMANMNDVNDDEEQDIDVLNNNNNNNNNNDYNENDNNNAMDSANNDDINVQTSNMNDTNDNNENNENNNNNNNYSNENAQQDNGYDMGQGYSNDNNDNNGNDNNGNNNDNNGNDNSNDDDGQNMMNID